MKAVAIKNLTGKTVRIQSADKSKRVIVLLPETSAMVPAIEMEMGKRMEPIPFDGENLLSVFTCKTGSIKHLPDPEPDTVFIVNQSVARALAGSRSDIFTPSAEPLSAGLVHFC